MKTTRFLFTSTLTLLLLASSARADTITIPTSYGQGADAGVSENNGTDNGNGTNTTISVRYYSTTPRNDTALLRFDLSQIVLGSVTAASFNLVMTAGPSGTHTYQTYGVTNTVNENWSESTITFSSAPGLTFDGDPLTSGITNSTLVGSASFTSGAGNRVMATGTGLIDFLNVNTDGIVNLVVIRTTASSGTSQFQSKENTSAPNLVLTATLKTKTTTALVSSPNPSITGSNVLFTASVQTNGTTAIDATGAVVFKEGLVALSTNAVTGGVAMFSTSALSQGSHTITAEYSGNANYLPSTNTVIQLVNANLPATATVLTALPNPSLVTSNVTFTATVKTNGVTAANASGTVVFNQGVTPLSTNSVTSGVATFSTSALATGSHLITAQYSGDANYAGSLSATVTQVVQTVTTTILTASPNPSVLGGNATFTATVQTNGATAVLAAGSVVFKIGGTPLGTNTVASGVAAFTTSALPAGTNLITAEYQSDGIYLSSTNSPALAQFVQTLLTVSLNNPNFEVGIPTSPHSDYNATVPGWSEYSVYASGIGFWDNSNGNLSSTFPFTGLGVASLIVTVPGTGDDAWMFQPLGVVDADAVGKTFTLGVDFGGKIGNAARAANVDMTVAFRSGTANNSSSLGTLLGTAGVRNIQSDQFTNAFIPFERRSATFTPVAGDVGTMVFAVLSIHENSYTGSTGEKQFVADNVTLTTNLPPTVAITSPTNGATFVVPASLTLTATAAVHSASSITSVEFFAGATPLGIVTNSPYTLTITNTSQSVIAYSALATDTLGLSALSAPVTITNILYLSASGIVNGDFETGANASPGGFVTTASGWSEYGTSTVGSGATGGFWSNYTNNLAATYPAAANSTYPAFFGWGCGSLITVKNTETAGMYQLLGTVGSNDVGKTFTLNAAFSGRSTSTTPTANLTVGFATGTSSSGRGTVMGTSSTSLISCPNSNPTTLGWVTNIAIYTPVSGDVGTSIYAFVDADQQSTASNSGQKQWLADNVTFLVRTTTTTTLASLLNPSTNGNSVTFTAMVQTNGVTAGASGGSVMFMDGAAALGSVGVTNGVASLATSSLSPGYHSITANYLGDATFGPSISVPVAQAVKVTPATVITAVGGSPNPSVVGDYATFEADVKTNGVIAGDAGGTMIFKDGATTLDSIPVTGGVAYYSISTLTPGWHYITAVYSGDGALYLASTSSVPVAQAVASLGQTPTTTSLGSSLNPSTYGNSVTLTATVSFGDAGGTMVFKDGAVTLGSSGVTNGVATFTSSALSAGPHALTVEYSGSATYGPSPAALTQVVQLPTTMVLASSANPSTLGSNIVFTATVRTNGVTAGAATGTMDFYADAGYLATANVNNGVASYTNNILTLGSHAMTAQYNGDTLHLASTNTPALTQVVKLANSLALVSSLNPSTNGNSVTFTATVQTNGVAAGDATGTVVFKKGATSLSTNAVTGGVASYSTGALSVGTNSLTAEFGGDTNYLASISTALAQVVRSSLPATGTNLIWSVSGSQLTISWPGYLGWILQGQTNTLGTGLGTNWTDIAGSDGVTSTNLPIVPGNPSVFYRLRHP